MTLESHTLVYKQGSEMEMGDKQVSGYCHNKAI